MWKNKEITEVTEMIRRILKESRYLIDKVVLADASTSEIWIYYGLLVFVAFTRWAG
jgi:hypothetical protein